MRFLTVREPTVSGSNRRGNRLIRGLLSAAASALRPYCLPRDGPAQAELAGVADDGPGRGRILGSDADRVEEGDVRWRAPSPGGAGQDVAQGDQVVTRDDAALDAADDRAAVAQRVRGIVDGDHAGALQQPVVDLGAVPVVRADAHDAASRLDPVARDPRRRTVRAGD